MDSIRRCTQCGRYDHTAWQCYNAPARNNYHDSNIQERQAQLQAGDGHVPHTLYRQHPMSRETADAPQNAATTLIPLLSDGYDLDEDAPSSPLTFSKIFRFNALSNLPDFKEIGTSALLAEALASWGRQVEDWAKLFQAFVIQFEEIIPFVPADIDYSPRTGFDITITLEDNQKNRDFMDDAARRANTLVRELFAKSYADIQVTDPVYGRGIKRRGGIPAFHGEDSSELDGVQTPTPTERGKATTAAAKLGGESTNEATSSVPKATTAKAAKATVARTSKAKAPKVAKTERPPRTPKTPATLKRTAANADGNDAVTDQPAPKKRAPPKKKAKTEVTDGGGNGSTGSQNQVATPKTLTPQSNMAKTEVMEVSGIVGNAVRAQSAVPNAVPDPIDYYASARAGLRFFDSNDLGAAREDMYYPMTPRDYP